MVLFHVCSMYVTCILLLIPRRWGFRGRVGRKVHRSLCLSQSYLLLSFVLVISCQDCKRTELVIDAFIPCPCILEVDMSLIGVVSFVTPTLSFASDLLCTHSYSVLIVCFSLVFHIVFTLGSLDTRAPVCLPIFRLFIYAPFFAFRVSTSSGDIIALRSLSICYVSFVLKARVSERGLHIMPNHHFPCKYVKTVLALRLKPGRSQSQRRAS